MPEFTTSPRVGCALELDPADRLRIGGADARDFLHRVSASEVRDLGPGVVRHLLFTDDKGGLVDAPLVAFQDGGHRVFAAPGRGPDLRAWLEKWIIVDDVVIEPDEEAAWLLGEPDLGRGRLLVPTTAAGPAVQAGGEAPPSVPLAGWEAACFRARRFFAGSATSTRPNPLELGWKDLVAFDKGCYIGQEVIARMDSYDKVRRGLATVSLAGELPAGSALALDGKKRGQVLSSVVLDEGVFAWALLDKALEPGTRLDDDATLLHFA